MFGKLQRNKQETTSQGIDYKFEILRSILLAAIVIMLELGVYVYFRLN